MTATIPPRRQVLPIGVVYGYRLRDPRTGEIRIDYIGQTRQRGKARELQHREDKPWSDLILGDPVILWEQRCTDADLNAKEEWFIRYSKPRPRMNWKLNEDNPEQIPIPRQKEQRWARDDAARLPRWAPPAERVPASLLDMPMRQPSLTVSGRRRSAAQPWRPWQKRLVGWSSAWLAVVGVVFFLLAYFGVFATVGDDFVAALISGSTLIVWVMRGAPVPVGRWRRRARKVRRWLW